MSLDRKLDWIFVLPIGFFVGVGTGAITQLFSGSPWIALAIGAAVLLALVLFMFFDAVLDRLFWRLMRAFFESIQKEPVDEDFGKDMGRFGQVGIAAVGFLIGIGATLIWTPEQIMGLL